MSAFTVQLRLRPLTPQRRPTHVTASSPHTRPRDNALCLLSCSGTTIPADAPDVECGKGERRRGHTSCLSPATAIITSITKADADRLASASASAAASSAALQRLDSSLIIFSILTLDSNRRG